MLRLPKRSVADAGRTIRKPCVLQNLYPSLSLCNFQASAIAFSPEPCVSDATAKQANEISWELQDILLESTIMLPVNRRGSVGICWVPDEGREPGARDMDKAVKGMKSSLASLPNAIVCEHDWHRAPLIPLGPTWS